MGPPNSHCNRMITIRIESLIYLILWAWIHSHVTSILFHMYVYSHFSLLPLVMSHYIIHCMSIFQISHIKRNMLTEQTVLFRVSFDHQTRCGLKVIVFLHIDWAWIELMNWHGYANMCGFNTIQLTWVFLKLFNHDKYSQSLKLNIR